MELRQVIPVFPFTFCSLSLFQMAANGLLMSTGTISYDAFGQRMMVRNYGVVGNQTFALDQLMLFNQVKLVSVDIFQDLF